MEIIIKYFNGRKEKYESFDEIKQKTGKSFDDLDKEGGKTIKAICVGVLHKIPKN